MVVKNRESWGSDNTACKLNNTPMIVGNFIVAPFS